MKRILVVDDEKDVREMLKEYLQMEEYLVDMAGSGEEALKEIGKQPDLILLDVNMPGMDGYTLCERIRGQISCPILFLTARTEERDRVNGFKAGGDDYILKPFSVEELIARVEAHLRREERCSKRNKVYISEDIIVDFDGRSVCAEGKDIGLTKTEFSILELLLTNAGQVFDKERIYESVRGFDGEADASIVMEHVRRIRKKLNTVSDKEYIETVWGVGYKWIG